ncbi:50S ribosomal protein L18 [Patescibacteria group bacterium]|nr:50S ribosomal protein L18 [Patescibacteria group bacterium]
MNKQELKNAKRIRRHKRVRAKVKGSESRPRLAVFRASQHIYAQVIDDASGKVLAAASSLDIKSKANKSDKASEVGALIAKKSLEKNIKEVVFDRGGYQYHGRVKALAEAARQAGLKF